MVILPLPDISPSRAGLGQPGHADLLRRRGEDGAVGHLGPAGTVVAGLRGDEHGTVAAAVEQGVAGRGGRDHPPVRQQEVEPPVQAGRPHRGDGARQGVRGGQAPFEPLPDQRPQQRGIDPGLQLEQRSRGQRRGQPGGGRRPARQHPVMAEQPAARRVRGAAAVPGSVPAVAERTAASTAAAEVTRATSAKDSSPQIGTGPPVPGRDRVVRRVPADPEPVRVHRPVPLPARCPRLPVQAVRRVDDHRAQRGRRPEVGQMPAHQSGGAWGTPPGGGFRRSPPASTLRAVRNPAKICRLIG